MLAHIVFEKLERQIRSGFSLTYTQNISKRAQDLILKKEAVLITTLLDLDLDLELNPAKGEVDDCENELT